MASPKLIKHHLPTNYSHAQIYIFYQINQNIFVYFFALFQDHTIYIDLPIETTVSEMAVSELYISKINLSTKNEDREKEISRLREIEQASLSNAQPTVDTGCRRTGTISKVGVHQPFNDKIKEKKISIETRTQPIRM